MLNAIKKIGKLGIQEFKEAGWINRIAMILATIGMVDLLTSASFYKLLFTGVVLYLIHKLLKRSKVFAVVSVTIIKFVGKTHKQTLKTKRKIKKSVLVKRIVMIIATITLVDSLITGTFLNLFLIGIVAFFIYRLYKRPAVYTAVNSAIIKVRKLTA